MNKKQKILFKKGGSFQNPLYAVGFTRFPTWLRSLVPFLEFKEGRVRVACWSSFF